MSDNTSPALGKSSFRCPHVECGAIAHQDWFELDANKMKGSEPPSLMTAEWANRIVGHLINKGSEAETFMDRARREIGGEILLISLDNRYGARVLNVWLSKCFSCNKFSIWWHGKLLHPKFSFEIVPNKDLPGDIAIDFLEAAAILDLSPRGAAALLRLCVQKLCAHLGKPGKDINADIKALVQDGLSPRIQRALDIVRVIGNNAVHPGKMDLRDDRDTAVSLFRLVNLIVEKTISETKHIDDFYGMLPDGAKAAIDKRDA